MNKKHRPRLSVLGIDPGLSGAAAVLDESLLSYDYMPWTTLENAYKQVRFWKTTGGVDLAVLEELPLIPGKGHWGVAKLHRNYGQWEGLLKGLGISYVLLKPKDWQTILIPAMPLVMGKGKGKITSAKKRSVITARILIPSLKKVIYQVQHHNISDAFLLAYRGLDILKVKRGKLL